MPCVPIRFWRIRQNTRYFGELGNNKLALTRALKIKKTAKKEVGRDDAK